MLNAVCRERRNIQFLTAPLEPRVAINPEHERVVCQRLHPINLMLRHPLGVRFIRSIGRVITAATAAGQARVVRHMQVIGIALALLTLVGGAFSLWDTHRRTIEDAERDLSDLGIVLAGQVSRYIQVVDLLPQEIQSRSLTLGIGSPTEFRDRFGDEDTQQLLIDRMKNLPQAHATSLFDADGMLLNTSYSNPVPRTSIAGRDYFEYLRDHADSGAFVSAPTRSRNTDALSIFFARRLSGPDGIFLGVVVAAVDVEYLLNFYQALTQAHHIAVTLRRQDGILLARYPPVAIDGQAIPIASDWHAEVAAGGGNFQVAGYRTGVKVIVSIVSLHNYPLVVSVAIPEKDVLATWRRQAAFTAGAEVLLASAFIVLFWMVARQMRRQDEHNFALCRTADELREGEGRLRKSERTLTAYAEMSADWFWEQDAELLFVRHSNIPLTTLPTDVGRARWDLGDSAMDQRRWDAHKADLAARRPFRDFRWERIRVDGKRSYMSTSGDPIFDGTGGFVGYHGTGRDITAEIASLDRAEQAETLLRDAVDSMSEGFVIHDREDCFVICNEPYPPRLQQDVPRGR